MGTEFDPLGIGTVEEQVVDLARSNLCYGACIAALGRAWHNYFKDKYGPETQSPAPQDVWRRSSEKAEARVKALEAELAALPKCGTCDGSGVIDSGGFDQNGGPIDVPCHECSRIAALEAENAALRASLALYRSMVLSGEDESDISRSAYEAAMSREEKPRE